MEKYIPFATPTDMNEEEIKLLCQEIFHRHIRRELKDLKVLKLNQPMQPEYYESESGWHILVFQQLMVFFQLN